MVILSSSSSSPSNGNGTTTRDLEPDHQHSINRRRTYGGTTHRKLKRQQQSSPHHHPAAMINSESYTNKASKSKSKSVLAESSSSSSSSSGEDEEQASQSIVKNLFQPKLEGDRTTSTSSLSKVKGKEKRTTMSNSNLVARSRAPTSSPLTITTPKPTKTSTSTKTIHSDAKFQSSPPSTSRLAMNRDDPHMPPSTRRDHAHDAADDDDDDDEDDEILLLASPPSKKRKLKPKSTTLSSTTRAAINSLPPLSRPKPKPRLSRATTPSSSASIDPSSTSNLLRSPAKDLSAIFETFSANLHHRVTTEAQGPGPSSPSSSTQSDLDLFTNNNKVVTAMARRTRTEPDLTKQGSLTPTSLNRSPNLRPLSASHSATSLSPIRRPTSPLRPSTQPPPSLSTINVPALIESGAIAPRGAGAGVKKTYGGARSFKRDRDEEALLFGSVVATSSSTRLGKVRSERADDEEDQDSQSTQIDDSLEPTGDSQHSLASLFNLSPVRPARRSYSSMRTEYGVDIEESLLIESERNSSLKSITQLSAKGDSTRFADELSYLMEGLTSPNLPIGVRRSSAIEVVKRVSTDRQFLRRLKASGLIEGVYKDFRKSDAGEGLDRVLDLALACFLYEIVKDQRSCEPLMRLNRSDVAKVEDKKGHSLEEVDLLGVVRNWLGLNWAGEILGHSSTSIGVVKGAAKLEQRSLSTLRDLLVTDPAGPFSAVPISLESLSILILSSITSFEPRAIFRPQQLICTSGALASLLTISHTQTTSLRSRIPRFEKGLDLLPPASSSTTTTTSITLPTISLYLLSCQLGVFETCLSVCPQLTLGPLSDASTELVASLSTIILASHLIIFGQAGSTSTTLVPTTVQSDSEEEDSDQDPSSRANPDEVKQEALSTLLSCLKLMVQMTITDSRWSAEFISDRNGEIVVTLVRIIQGAKSRIAQPVLTLSDSNAKRTKAVTRDEEDDDKEEEDQEQSVKDMFDVLCLALGALTNFVESVDRVKSTLRETLISPLCHEVRKCTQTCRCDDREPLLVLLAQLYISPPSTDNELNDSFLRGYSGLLLGLTMLDSSSNQAIVESVLQGHDRARQDLKQAMSEFANLHEDVHQQQQQEGGSGQGQGLGGPESFEQVDQDFEGQRAGGNTRDGQVANRIREMLNRMKESG